MMLDLAIVYFQLSHYLLPSFATTADYEGKKFLNLK